METWLFLLLLLISTTLFLLRRLLTATKHRLPPGPTNIPIISIFLLLLKPFSEIEPMIRNLQAKLGPIISLQINSHTAVFISDHALAHKALIQNGAVFSDRPKSTATDTIISSNQRTVSTAVYGPTWRLLRRNLTSEILHPSRVKSYAAARKWVLHVITNRLITNSKSESGEGVKVIEHLRFGMFCLLVLMCFGDKLDESQIINIEKVQRKLLVGFQRFNVLNFWPRLTKIVLKTRWKEFFDFQKDQADMLLPLIRARKEAAANPGDDHVVSYVDTLWGIEFPEEKRKLTEEEIVALCSEFLDGGTDTTSSALQWILANIVKYPKVQERLVEEIKGVVEGREEEVKEEVLNKMLYLKAVVLEGLRRHPPAHFVLPHAVRHDVEFEGYVVPKKGSVNFMVADVGWDEKVWEEPMEFRPERFLGGGEGEGVDITGTREIKMMPFGVGRRICTGLGLAMLHLEYYVANLVWKFEWKEVEGEEVDFSEKQEFTIGMKNPLKAHISPRVVK